MDKKGIIAVAIAIITLVVWQIYFAPKPPVPSAQAAVKGAGTPASQQLSSPSAAPTAAPSVAPATTADKSKTPVPAEASVEPKTETVTSPEVDYLFTNLGGGISRALLKEHKGDNETNVTLNEHGAFPIGAVSDQPSEDVLGAYTVTANQQAAEVVCERTTQEQVH
ncbi:MAG: hypothetical protein WCH43_14120, partial [Verrucomicrobiota bacterium]